MKDWFVYQKGSYWIYKDDSTGALDSTYVTSTNDFIHDYTDYDKTTMKAEWVFVYFNSKFLSNFIIEYSYCEGPNRLTVGSHFKTPEPGMASEDGDIAYFLGWPSNVKIIPNCWKGEVFFYKVISTDTINQHDYSNLIYSEVQWKDSSLTNPQYYLRKISFAKHIGIVKYFEVSQYYNVNRSYSLLRYKTVQ
jgi:hypothetical protein